MDVKYDIMADAVYVNVSKSKVARTVKTNERFLVDMDANDNVVGFEILDASSQEELVGNLQRNLENGVPITIDSGNTATAQ